MNSRFKCWAIVISFLCAFFNPFLFLGTSNSPFVWAEDEITDEPELVIGGSSSIPVMKAGETKSLIIPVRNIHFCGAKNIIATMTVDDVSKFPFIIDKVSTKTSVSPIGGNTNGSIIFSNLQVSPYAENKTYAINLSVSYTSDNGNDGSASGTVYVNIENSALLPEIKLAGLQLENEKLDTGEDSIVQLKLRNNGDLDAYRVTAQMTGFTSNGISLEQDTDTWTVKEFKAKEFKYVPYNVYVNSALESGTYTLDLTIKYYDANNNEYTEQAKVHLPVIGTGGDGQNEKWVPRLIIGNYNFGAEYARAGEIFPLTISFNNTHVSKSINNIKISLSADDNIFSPVSSSSTFYISQIGPGENLEKVIELKPKIDATNKTYNVTVDMEYEDEKGNKYTEKGMIGIPVAQDLGLTLAEVQTSPDCFIGNPTGISVDYYNTGRALVRNLLIRTEGDFSVKDGELYIGNLESGKTDYYDATITPEKEGELAGRIIFSYEDEIGNHYEQVKEFTMLAAAMPEMPSEEEMMGKRMMQEPQEKSSSKVWLVGGGLLFTGILVIAWVIHKKRLKKKMEALELDE